MSTRYTLPLLTAAAVLLLNACQPVPVTEAPELKVSAVAEAGVDVHLTLADGAGVTIPAGGVEPGDTVEMQMLNRADQSWWQPTNSDGFQVGPVYEITAGSNLPGFEAAITLPFDPYGLTEEQITATRIAYYLDGQWVALPSVADADAHTVTATVHHLSLFTWTRRLVGNQAPPVTLSASPTAYADVEYTLDGEKYFASVDDLVIDIYATDPEAERLSVYCRVNFDTVVSQAISDLAGWSNTFGEALAYQMFWITLVGEGGVSIGPAPALLAEQIRTGLQFPETHHAITGPIIDLSDYKIAPGHYQMVVDVSALPLDGDLDSIEVQVLVYDDVPEEPVERTLIIPVTRRHIPAPPIPVGPGPTALMLCPSQPTFEWRLQDAETNSYRFRLVRGDDPWSGHAAAEWTCRLGSSGAPCSGSGPADYYAAAWQPAAPLSDGVYSWAMAASSEHDESAFRPPDSSRSAGFQFTVDGTLEGDSCVERSTLTPLWVDLTTEGTEVWRSRVFGTGSYHWMSWEIYEGDELILSRVADDELTLDLAAIYGAEAVAGRTFTIHIAAVVDDSHSGTGRSSRPISAAVTVTFPPQAAPDATPTYTAPPSPTAEQAATPTPTSTPTTTPPPAPAGCFNDLAFVADVTVPDGTSFAPGEHFTKTWRVQNIGTCPWTADYRFVFYQGDRMSGPDSIPAPAAAPGAQVEISVNLTAPTADGTYRSWWVMVDPTGKAFGQTPYVEIVVGSGGGGIIGMANPAAAYCGGLGYRLETRSGPFGEAGYCIFPDGSECDEWAFLRGECGQSWSYCARNGYTLQPYNEESGLCVFPNGSSCPEYDYFNRQCGP